MPWNRYFKQKKMKKFFLLLAVAVGCLWTLCSCQKTAAFGHYYDIIPANSRGVCAIHVNRLIEKGEMTEVMQERLAGFFGLQEILKNMDESGIDFSDYLFIVADSIGGNAALVAKVKDADKLKDIFVRAEKEGKCTPLTTRGQYNETIISGDFICSFDSNVLFCTMSYNQKRAREYALRLSERKNESMAADACFQRILEGKNDVELLFSMKGLPESMRSNFMMHVANPDFDPSQINVNGSLNFENGKLSLQYTLISSNPAVMQALLEQGNGLEKVSERLLAYYPASTFLCALYSCHGDKVNKILEENHFWQDMPMVDPLPVQQLLASLDGDMVYGITGWSAMGIPNILVYARVKDGYPADLLADISKKKLGQIGVLEKTGKHRYRFSNQMMDIHFGVKDGKLFYLTNDPEAYSNLGKAVKNPWNKTEMASGIKGSYGGIVLNVEELLRSPVVLLMLQQTIGRQQAVLLQKILSGLSYMEFITLAPNHGVWNIYMKNQKQNSLKTLMEIGKELTEN